MKRIRFKPIFLLFLICAISPLRGEGDRTNDEKYPDVNIILSIEGMPTPEQVFQLGDLAPDFGVTTLPIDAGKKVKLNIQLVDSSGEYLDIT